jgi:prepilin-type N-terminal cleavage/methylation domain-containing protein
MGILSAIIGTALFYALLPLLLSPCFSWAGAKKELRLVLGAWKRCSYASCICKRREGFTLIELSIVLVIIGLVVGGILLGRDLIGAATVRAQITQIEKYNTAANTFISKCGGLPGDISAQGATACGLAARGQYQGEGDGDSVIASTWNNAAGGSFGTGFLTGEEGLFWVDLSATGLIDSAFNTANATTVLSTGTNVNPTLYLPAAKIGSGNYVYVWSGGPQLAGTPNSINYFGLSSVTGGIAGCSNCAASNPALSVAQAYAIDTKIDDGLPQSGQIIAVYTNGGLGATWAGGASQVPPYTTGTPGSSTSCFDNGNSAGSSQQYSMEQNSSGLNCALSFQMQGAAR